MFIREDGRPDVEAIKKSGCGLIITMLEVISLEQKSDVQFRAAKLYKNVRGKFGLLIREVVSNAIHATMIREKNEAAPQYQPKVEITINQDEGQKSFEIIVTNKCVIL